MSTRAAVLRQKKSVEKIGEVERVYRILHGWLVTAKLAPGTFLSEADLAARCRTSRTPVREAFTRLMQDKWLSRIPRKGFLVTPISVRDILELYEVRKVLECFAVEKVAQSASPAELEQLHSILLPEESLSAPLESILEANEAFHLRLSELAGNLRVSDQLRLSLGYVKRLDTLCTQTVPGWIGHREILRAIEKHAPAEARRAMTAHIELSRDKMVKLFSY
jgi:DNA-binding GntR family transcriptional regulator